MSVYEKIIEIVCKQFEISSADVNRESGLRDDLGADSLDLVDLAMSIEDDFRVEVPDKAIEKFKTVGDIVDFVEKKM